MLEGRQGWREQGATHACAAQQVRHAPVLAGAASLGTKRSLSPRPCPPAPGRHPANPHAPSRSPTPPPAPPPAPACTRGTGPRRTRCAAGPPTSRACRPTAAPASRVRRAAGAPRARADGARAGAPEEPQPCRRLRTPAGLPASVHAQFDPCTADPTPPLIHPPPHAARSRERRRGQRLLAAGPALPARPHARPPGLRLPPPQGAGWRGR